MPFGNDSCKSVRTLGYLNSQQALADFAYLEEVEKYSKPGSVAAKKLTLIEMHCERIAAEKAIALLGEDNEELKIPLD
ncbi:hypothetical protein RJ640_012469 [Escallonia rubra]|uniref:Uncharacterized protein n=1 Tax=Escallonia rubra TaxID=112253 RepID=A0AA88UA63_9ASTE|nr:hypothetical protein RJ640_012469 [Escallonia rubra]